MWVERLPKSGESVKIEWSEWYSDLIGCKSTIGIFLKSVGDKLIIDIGDRLIYLNFGSTLHVFENK